MPSVSSAIPAVATVGSAIIGGRASSSAASAQSASANRAAELENQRFKRMRADLEPYRLAGLRSMGVLESLMYGTPLRDTSAKHAAVPKSGTLWDAYTGKKDPITLFTESPGYKFNLDEGRKAIEASAAARGGTVSGATLKDLTRFQQGYASNEYNNFLNRVAGMAQTGQNSAAATGSAGLTSAANASQAILAGGQAKASGYVGQANAMTGALSSLSNIAGQYYQQQQQPQTPYYNASPYYPPGATGALGGFLLD